ncbi:MAG: 50S ribosomal protein L9 [Ilumatobacteraceae bacterium]
MKVLLRSDIAGVGRRGDIITVSSGHARNYLLPKGLAIEATQGTVSQAEVMRRSRDQREAAERTEAHAIGATLSQQAFVISAKAGKEGRLFGSVSSGDIVDAILQQANITIDRKKISITSPIRTVGEHTVSVDLVADIETVIKLSVVAL